MTDVPITVRERALAGEAITGDCESLPPLLQRIYLGRGILDAQELRLTLDTLALPARLPDIDKAATRLANAVIAGERILIVGDFDADGATAVTLAVSLLEAFGATDVRFVVPNRFDFGYGLSVEIVKLALEQQPDVIVTVDNGVSSIAGVTFAREHGVDVIVTDHHLPGAELPPAYAIVNPNLRECAFPSRALAGVGVIYYVLGSTRAVLKGRGWFESRVTPNLADWLDLVALGTIADVVPLDHNNRVLVQQGIKRMRAGRCRPGIRALADVAGRTLSGLSTQDLGFALGPRLNAAGRLDDMTLGIRCLLATDEREAREMAVALDELNRTRRALEQDMVSDAEMLVAAHSEDVSGRFGVCVYDAGWHQGIIGIVAGRLREKFNRPVIAFAEAGNSAPDELKGSARSLPQLHVRDVLDAIAARFPGMLVRFGGHAAAAGLSIKRVHYKRFEKAFNDAVMEVLPEEALSPVILTDGRLSEAELSLGVARQLAQAGPWGQQFPEPVFHDEFELVNQRVVGETHLKLVLRKGARLVDAISFRQPPLEGATRVQVVYRLQQNEYRGAVTLQLVVEHLSPLA